MKTKSEIYQIENELEWVNPSPGVKRQIMGYDGQIMVVKVDFETGAIGTQHQHYHSQATYVDSGVFELNIKGEKKILKRGDGYYVEPDALHGCVCLEAGRLIDVFSPMRQDFLN
ncbi:cupin [Bacteroidia bacterium]|nr:cupin [Bacteroidia bacterium]GHV42893.1 cupin [Bacteroidia bacterium]